MFDVVWCRDANGDHSQQYRILSERHKTLEDALNARVCSGDLVVHSDTNCIVANDGWLWDWEKSKPESYANRMRGQSAGSRSIW
jgi:hypothetical protein